MIILLALRNRRDLRRSELGQALVAIPNLTALVLQREVEAKNGNGIREVFLSFSQESKHDVFDFILGLISLTLVLTQAWVPDTFWAPLFV